MSKKDIMRLDANETAFFKRQLEYVKTKTYDTKYKNLKAKMLIPVSTEAPAGADFIIWYSYSKAGQAKIIADYAHDFPRVDIYATENQSKIRSLGDSYGYSIKEIRRAQVAGSDLSTRRSNTARRAIEELIDNLAWYGDDDFNMQGFFDYPGITEYATPAGASTTKQWTTKTPDEIIADLTGILNSISIPTKGREEADTILLPRAQYNLIKDTRMTDGNTNTILMFFKSNNPGVDVMVLDELAGQGASSSDRMMAYVRDAEHLTLETPQPFEQLEADKKGMEYAIPCHAEIGGVIIYYPQSVAFGDNI
jgi:hypothetical protein